MNRTFRNLAVRGASSIELLHTASENVQRFESTVRYARTFLSPEDEGLSGVLVNLGFAALFAWKAYMAYKARSRSEVVKH